MYFHYYNLLSQIHMGKFHVNLTSDKILKGHIVKINEEKTSLKMESGNPEGIALTHKPLTAACFTYADRRQLTLPSQE